LNNPLFARENGSNEIDREGFIWIEDFEIFMK
jgi:hypothetical protein